MDLFSNIVRLKKLELRYRNSPSHSLEKQIDTLLDEVFSKIKPHWDLWIRHKEMDEHNKRPRKNQKRRWPDEVLKDLRFRVNKVSTASTIDEKLIAVELILNAHHHDGLFLEKLISPEQIEMITNEKWAIVDQEMVKRWKDPYYVG